MNDFGKSLLLALFFVATAGVSSATADGSGSLLSGTWKGHYDYPEMKGPAMKSAYANGVDFDANFTASGNEFEGVITESTEAKSGDTEKTELRANVKGTVSAGKVVKFTKTYDGTGGWKHSVEYAGDIDEEKGILRVRGIWQIGPSRGTFDMQRQSSK
jgi:hypothetical protein